MPTADFASQRERKVSSATYEESGNSSASTDSENRCHDEDMDGSPGIL